MWNWEVSVKVNLLYYLSQYSYLSPYYELLPISLPVISHSQVHFLACILSPLAQNYVPMMQTLLSYGLDPT